MLLGADPATAAQELMESLRFEMRLANISLPRELRRDATRLYNPRKLGQMADLAPIVDWTEYVNKVLTPEIIQAS